MLHPLYTALLLLFTSTAESIPSPLFPLRTKDFICCTSGGGGRDGTLCLKYIGKSSWLLDVKRVYREIDITISNTSTEQNQGSLEPSHTA